MFVGGDSVESVILYRQKGKSRVSKFVLAILGLTIIAVGVSFAGNGAGHGRLLCQHDLFGRGGVQHRHWHRPAAAQQKGGG